MTDLPSNQAYIQSEETDTESPISEQTMQKIGSAINYLNDYLKARQEFTSSGTFNVPENVDTIYLMGCGGGGGGINVISTPTNTINYGGFGAKLSTIILSVTPLDSISVTIGAGGSAGTSSSPAGDGGNTIFGSLAIFYGGSGGRQLSSTRDNPMLLLHPSSFISGNILESLNGNMPWIRSEYNSIIYECAPENTANYQTTPSSATDWSNIRRGGAGGFGIGGAGNNASTASSAAINTGGGGGSSLNFAGGGGGSGKLIIAY